MERHDDYLDPYRDAIERHGPSFEATLWGSRDAQVQRFDVMIGLVEFEGRRVLDVGCGRGDLAARLRDQEIEYEHYTGIDAVAPMIEWASAQAYPRCSFVEADVVAEPERLASFTPHVVCISGALNTMDDPIAQGLIRACFECAEEAVVFNFLSDRPAARWEGRDLTPARRFPTMEWIDWALSLTPQVAFTQAYLDGHDATIAIWHPGRADA